MADSVPMADPSVREMEIDGDITLFHAATQTALVLNGTASDVWRLIDGERTLEEIVAALDQAYDADPETVRAGVDSALTQLREHGLLASGNSSISTNTSSGR
ncbi:PqqD family protein [Phytoactinopolyspora halotolerans]|uniref:PqqD family protein n=1 Tax=Phytoactinopolyspora halotolerans TaxID=1981512 RepID=A0A6L9S2D9_9ACTN|nr:PqqD family protein [Phytoactinopolyspora halotolerans]NED99624.1 PqqD family protein [Phytoactinopolyspora halotolerans]